MDISPLNIPGPHEIYSDAARVGSTPFGFVFDFGLSTQTPGEAQTQAIVRMSPQHALVFYQILKQHLRNYELNIGKISLPDEIFDELRIERDI